MQKMEKGGGLGLDDSETGRTPVRYRPAPPNNVRGVSTTDEWERDDPRSISTHSFRAVDSTTELRLGRPALSGKSSGSETGLTHLSNADMPPTGTDITRP